MTLLSNKRLTAFAVGFMALVAAMFIVFCSPSTSYAATLGSEEPQVYFTYEKDGVEVDGNVLLNGAYDVKIWVKGLEKISTFQITATVDNTVICASEPTALMSDSVADVVSMGYVLDGTNIVFGFVSDNDDCSTINSEATLVASLGMTFTQGGDAENHITVSANPNLTFAQTNYNDGYEDSYAIDTEFDGYTGALYPMTCDVSPAFSSGHTVTGSLVVMTNSNGATEGVAVSGVYTVDVYSDEARTQLVTSVESIESVENNSKNNTYVIDGLADGTYYLSISSEYAITRDDITLIVDGADISADAIPMLACDFDRSTSISAGDAVTIYINAAGAQNAYCDLDGSGSVSAGDAVIVYSCSVAGFREPITISNKG